MMHFILFTSTILAIVVICIVSYNLKDDTEDKT